MFQFSSLGRNVMLRQFIKRSWRKGCLLAALVISINLAGCATPTPPQPAKPTVAEQRAAYLCQLKKADVQTIKLGETYRFVLSSDRLFNGGTSSNIQTAYQPTLTTIAKFIQTYKTVAVKVAAYSDNVTRGQAPKGRKLALTNRQAELVAAYLWDAGINTRLLYTHGYGQHDAIASNASSKGRSLNRRVEISFRFYASQRTYD